jgi:outer membrane protein OmpA-like peptidoglycan-associated protein
MAQFEGVSMKSGFVLIVFFLATCNAGAQQPISAATVDELVNKLAAPKVVTRSLRNLVPEPRILAPEPEKPSSEPGSLAPDAINFPPEPRKIDLIVQFDFNSARLQEASKPLLASLAEAMGSERIKTLRIKVEGHTDAVGKASYNQLLSEKRAQSVLEFLSGMGVAKDRLAAEGKGASELLLPDKPDALENRRVRISTLN